MEIKSGVLDRIGQSFEILFNKKYFVSLIGLSVSYQVIYYIFISIFIFYSIEKVITPEFIESKDIFQVLYNPEIIEIIISFSIGLIILSILYLGVSAGTVKIIKDIVYRGETKTLGENTLYGWNKIVSMMYLYVHSFLYIILIPFIILIIGSVLSIISYLLGEAEMTKILSIITISSFVLSFIVFSIYRGIKSSFFIVRAIDREDYSKQGFYEGLSLSENNWWRITGNIILAAIIIGLLFSIVKGVFSMLGQVSGTKDVVDLLGNSKDVNTPEDIKNLLLSFSRQGSITSYLIPLFFISARFSPNDIYANFYVSFLQTYRRRKHTQKRYLIRSL